MYFSGESIRISKKNSELLHDILSRPQAKCVWSLQPALAKAVRVLMVICLCGAAVATAQKKRPKIAATQSLSVAEIDSRILQNQTSISEFQARRAQIVSDTLRLALQRDSELAAAQKKIDDHEKLLSQYAADRDVNRQKREAHRQDSISSEANRKKSLAAIQTSISAFNRKYATAISDRQALSLAEQQLSKKDFSQTLGEIEKLKKQAADQAAYIPGRQNELGFLQQERQKLSQDSIAADRKQANDRATFSQEIAKNSMSLAQLDSQIGSINQQTSGHRTTGEQQVSQEKTRVAELAANQAQTVAGITRLQSEQSSLIAERDRLSKATGAAQQKIQEQRAPLAGTLQSVETELAARKGEKEQLTNLIEKLRIDAQLNVARNELDAAIEASASGKRGGKKLVQEKEDALNALMRTQSQYTADLGVSQKEAKLAGKTLDQKRRYVSDYAAKMDSRITALTTSSMQAQQALADFDLKNKGALPELGRISEIESQVAAKKSGIAQLTTQRESLDVELASSRARLESANSALRDQLSQQASALTSANSERTNLAGRARQLKADSLAADAANSTAFSSIKARIAQVESGMQRKQQEIATASQQLQSARQSIPEAELRLKNEQHQREVDKQRAVSSIAAKEQEITSLAGQLQTLRHDSTNAQNTHAQKLSSTYPERKRLDSLLTAGTSAIAGVTAQRTAAQKELSEANRRFLAAQTAARKELAGIDSAIRLKETALSDLQKRRISAVAMLESRRARIESQIEQKSAEIESLRSQREDLVREIKAASVPASRPPAQVTAAPIVTTPATQSASSGSAQQILTSIYALLEKGKTDEAVRTFKGRRGLLQSQLDAETFRNLETTISYMAQ